MVARLTSFTVAPENAQETKTIYQQEVVPEVRKQKGNIDARLLEPTDGSNDFISITAWENKADADAYESSGKYKELVGKIQGLIGQPVLKTYTSQQ